DRPRRDRGVPALRPPRTREPALPIVALALFEPYSPSIWTVAYPCGLTIRTNPDLGSMHLPEEVMRNVNLSRNATARCHLPTRCMTSLPLAANSPVADPASFAYRACPAQSEPGRCLVLRLLSLAREGSRTFAGFSGWCSPLNRAQKPDGKLGQPASS